MAYTWWHIAIFKHLHQSKPNVLCTGTVTKEGAIIVHPYADLTICLMPAEHDGWRLRIAPLFDPAVTCRAMFGSPGIQRMAQILSD